MKVTGNLSLFKELCQTEVSSPPLHVYVCMQVPSHLLRDSELSACTWGEGQLGGS